MTRHCPVVLFVLVVATSCSPPIHGGTFSEIVVFGASGNLGWRTNGPAWVDYVAEDLDLPLRNFAVSSSGTDDVRRQVERYLECTDGTCLGEANPDSLYVSMHWSLGVDVGSGRGSSQAVQDAVANIVTLAEAGAKNFVNGRVSWIAAYAPRWRGDAGLLRRFHEAEAEFVSQVLSLEQTLGIRVFDVDLNGHADRVFASPGDYGFANVDKPLAADRDAPASQYVWWDETSHVTTAYHRLMADETLRVLRAVPEPTALIPFCAGCVGLFLFWRHGRRGT